jgi:hypothetical protein
VSGFWNEATWAPAESVNVMTEPLTWPKYLTFGCCWKGTTVRVVDWYVDHTWLM